jgi:adenosylhomocysteine nucleosidase
VSAPVDIAVFPALGWEARAVLDGLAHVEPGDRPRTWRGFLGDGGACYVAQTGVGPAQAAAAVAAAPDARLALAVGCAGGLVHGLVPGDLIAATEVLRLDAGGRVAERFAAVTRPLAAWATGRGFMVQAGPVASSSTVLSCADEKRVVAKTGALVVEMESAGVADVARRRGMSFAAVRVVLDGAADAVPVGGGIVDERTGDIRPWRAALVLASQPWRWPAIARIARQQRVADRRLRALLAMLLGGGGLDAVGMAPVGAAGSNRRSSPVDTTERV